MAEKAKKAEKVENPTEEFKSRILHALEVSKEISKSSNRNETFDNGFIEGFQSCTWLLMDSFADEGDSGKLEIEMEGFHRASHLLFGDAVDTNGKCSFIESYNRRILEALIKRMVEHVEAKGVKEEFESLSLLPAEQKTAKPN